MFGVLQKVFAKLGPRFIEFLLRYYPCKLSLEQKLLQAYLIRQTFALQFLAQCKLQNEWSWNILWTDLAHFHLDGTVNKHDFRILAVEDPHQCLQIPLNSSHVTVRCDYTATFILSLFFKSSAPQVLLHALPPVNVANRYCSNQ